MSLTGFSFFVFLIITLIAYYAIKPLQKYILLIASVYFYIKLSTVSTVKLCILMAFMMLVTYLGGILTGKTKGALKTVIFSLSLASIIAVLFVLKYAFNIFSIVISLFKLNAGISWLQFVPVAGLSYYALTAIGYLIDVYWGNYEPEKNPANIGLFIFYFPQLISGPFTRYSEMKDQFNARTPLLYENIVNGMRRMAWGYFKKLVISERFGVIVSAVYANYTDYSLVGIVIATLCYAVQLYTDFSGCMDIIMGCSEMFGINLPENFKAPFFSESLQEFWQRWHITLGGWFRDYFMYPVQKSKPVRAIGNGIKKIIGKKRGKKAPFYISMILLWLLIGLWHGGTGYFFLASAGFPCMLLILSDLLRPLFEKLVTVFKINTECGSWRWFRRIRTAFLVSICWIVACAGSVPRAVDIHKHMFTDLWNYREITSLLNTFGLTSLDVIIMVVGLVLLFISDRCIFRETTIFKVMDKQNAVFRIALIYAEVMIILLYGMVGTSSFIYFKF